MLANYVEFYFKLINFSTHINSASSGAIIRRQQETCCEILVASTQFSVASASRKVQFWTLDPDFNSINGDNPWGEVEAL